MGLLFYSRIFKFIAIIVENQLINKNMKTNVTKPVENSYQS